MNRKPETHETETGFSEVLRKGMKELAGIAKDTFHVFSDNDMSVFSGNATLYILMAMVPFFTLAAGMVNFLPEKYLRGFAETLLSLLPNIPQMRDMMFSLLSTVNPKRGTIVVSISLLTMLWSASNGVSALQIGMSRIGAGKQSMIRQRLLAMVYTVLFILLISALLIFRIFRSSIMDLVVMAANWLERPEIVGLFRSILKDGGLITSAAIAFVVLLTYSFLQGHLRSLRRQVPGAVFTTILWILFSSIFEWFISEFWNTSAVYGSLASIFLTAMWLKTIITILFLGASLNEALFRRSQNLEGTPDPAS